MQQPFTVWRQHFVPQHTLSRIYGKLSHCQTPWFKNWAIRRFIRLYGINMQEAMHGSAEDYASFHDFFTRHLKPNQRPIDALTNGICSPCDGTISQIGKIEHDTLLQAKEHNFSLSALLADQTPDQSLVQPFLDGHYTTVYLAPKDYHRVHMPFAGTLQHLRYIPGKLFSVNPLTAAHVPQLFARNERAIATFKNNEGTFAVILVGAMIVGSIFTRWSGSLTPHRGNKILHIDYTNTPDRHITLDKGEEIGYFSLGSTVILLFAKNLRWEQGLSQDSSIVLGQRMGCFVT